jgi:arginyl-tRNA synthetase
MKSINSKVSPSDIVSNGKITESLSDYLSGLFSESFRECGLDPKLGKVAVSQRPDLSQYQCNGALAAAQSTKANPRLIADKIVSVVKRAEIFSSLSIDGPGFINIHLTDAFLAHTAQSLLSNDYTEILPVSARKRTVIDFGGPNVAKPMHVGHLRTNIIGDCFQRLWKFLGVPIEGDIHLGDWGTPMGMVITEIERKDPHLTYFSPHFIDEYPAESPVNITDLELMYPAAAARCRENVVEMKKALKATAELQAGHHGYQALWKHFVGVSIAAIKEDLDQLGVEFDFWNGESHYHDRIPAMLNFLKDKGYAIESEGALVIPFPEGIARREVPPLILVKTDGAFLYGTTDLATVEERVELGYQHFLYIVDKRQSLHFEQIFAAAHKTGIAGDSILLEHVGYGTVNSSDGRPFKTRDGGVMKLKDLITLTKSEALKRINEVRAAEGYSEAERGEIAHKVGIAALKFGDLMHEPGSDYIFDLARFTSLDGRTGPYVLYSTVRINSILHKAEEQGLVPGEITKLTGAERELLLEMCKFPDVLLSAYKNRLPNHLCDYSFNLAQVFNRFYLHCHILREQDVELQSSWLGIVRLCYLQLNTLMNLLGIDLPNRM